jgi:hypothetical protein
MNISGPSTACSNANAQLCATTGSFTYQWSNGATTACITPSVSGNYSVVATNTNGCSKTASKGLTIYSPLNANITGPSSACTGSVVPLCASAGSSSYAWSNGATTDCINVNSNGVYSVIISDINGCTASATHPVSFSSTFTVDITGPPSGCNGSASELCVPSGYTSYAWSTGGTSECISVTTPGTYSVTIHDPVGCVANSFYSIPFSPPPSVSITGSTIICNGGITNWCATSGFPVYQWSNGGTAECINVTNDTTYTVVINDTNGCEATASANLIVQNIAPVIIESSGLLICDTFNNVFEYEWLINGLPTTCTGDTCLPTFSAVYTVNVTDTTTGCVETATYNFVSVGITVLEDEMNISIYPNPFTDNVFQIDFKEMLSEKIELEIYDALGRIVYSDQFKITSSLHSHPIQLKQKVAGIYYVNIRTEKGNVIRKVFGS